MTRIAAGYLRRSSATTANPGNDSREAQEAAVRRLAGDAVELYVDWNLSGSGDGSKRPDYQRLRQDIAEGRIESVTAYSLSRLGRNAHELLGLVELCNAHDVTLRTAMENLDTKTAFGKGMIGMLAVFAQLELDQGAERSASARQARKARHEAAGVPLPGSIAPWGWRNVKGEDGITRVERDESVNLHVIAAAYEQAGSVTRTAKLLNERGIPAPKGGQWGTTSLGKLLDRLAEEGLVTLPERNRAQRHPIGKPGRVALFAGLLTCHCGARMTPNLVRRQLYCGAARSIALHGRSAVTEKALVEQLRPEAEAYARTVKVASRQREADIAATERQIERKQAALDAKLDVGRIDPEAYRVATRKLDHELADLRRDDSILRATTYEPTPSWPEPGEDAGPMNAHLRRIWTRVLLDEDMRPTVIWRDSRYRVDPEREAATEAEDLQLGGLTSEPARLRVVEGGSR